MSSKNSTTELARKLAQLMAVLGLTQKQELAGLLDVSPTAILHWENGRSKPSAETYIRLGKLSLGKSSSLARWFFEQAEVDDPVIRALFSAAEESYKEFEKRLKNWSHKELEGFLPVPVIDDIGQGGHGDVMSRIRAAMREGIEAYVPFPKSSIPSPQATVCLRAPDDYMRPIFRRGDLLAVDISSEAKFSRESASESAKKIVEQLLVPLGDRAIFAAYYDRPSTPPRWRGRGGLHVRGIKFMVGNDGKPTGLIHLTTEMGLNIQAAVHALGGKPKSFSDLEEASDLIVPIDVGVSILGRVVAWVGSAWHSNRESTREYNFIDNFGVIGGQFNQFLPSEEAAEAAKPPRGRGAKK